MTSIIFQNLFDTIYESSKNVNSYFTNKPLNENDIYLILTSIPKDRIILYIFITFLVFNFISRYEIKLSGIFSLIISLIILYFLIRSQYSDFTKYTKNKLNQIRFLHKLMYDNKESYITASTDNIFILPMHSSEKSYLYLDPIIVQLFYDVKPISSFNISSYVDAVFHCNNILGIEYESKLGVNRNYLNYNTAILEKSKAMNSLNSAIYNMPEGTMIKYMKTLKLLQSVLNGHLKTIGQYFKNENKTSDLTINSVPDDFYDINFFISPDDTKTYDYFSVYNMYT
jgi:hypothetical protein